MFNANDDDDFFTPTSAASTSNLANIFGLQSTNDASLKYTPPKQPKDNEKKTQSVLLCVKTVQLHRLIDTSYVSIGKYGLALIGDAINNKYDLIIYKTKQHIISKAHLHPKFKYIQQKDNVASFRDDQNNSWLVYFNDTKDCLEFGNELKSRSIIVTYQDKEDASETNKVIMMADKPEEENARADILERISKVGHAMLPSTNTKNVDLSESEPEEVIRTKKIMRKPKRHSTSDKDMFSMHSADLQDLNQQFMVPVPSNSIQQQQYSLVNGQYVPNQMVQCLPTQMMSLNDPLNIHFAENRTHNSEIRMNLSQLNNKLETVLSELINIRTPKPEADDAMNSRVKELEKRLEALSKSKQTSDDVRILEQKCLDLEERLEDAGNLISRLNQQIDCKDSDCNQFEIVINELKDKLQAEQSKNECVGEENRNKHNTIDDLTIKNDEITKLYNAQRKDFQPHEQMNLHLKKLVESQVEEIKKLENDAQLLRHNNEEKIKAFTDVVKDCMNTMYQNILDKFDGSLNADVFKKVLSQHMKNATFRIINEYKSTLEDEQNKYIEPGDGNHPPVPEFEVTV